MALQDHQLLCVPFAVQTLNPERRAASLGSLSWSRRLELNPGLLTGGKLPSAGTALLYRPPTRAGNLPNQGSKSQGDGMSPMDSRGVHSHPEVFRA